MVTAIMKLNRTLSPLPHTHTHLLFILSLAEGILRSSIEGAAWRDVSFCKMTLPGIWRARCLLQSPGALPVPMVGGRRSEGGSQAESEISSSDRSILQFDILCLMWLKLTHVNCKLHS